ncbi:MAG: hypothetical protein ABII12_03890 [Planctomycetota bacterium]
MPSPLPKHPNLDHLKKSAKQLLAAQRRGEARCCHLLRSLRRFAEASDANILAARVSLSETQLVVAMHFGFSSWAGLREHALAGRMTNSNSIAAVAERCEQEIPDYCGAGVPLGVVAAMNHAGVEIDFMEFAAASGWAFSFGYEYGDISPAYMAVRGDPKSDGPLEVFAFLPGCFGLGYDMARTQDPDAVWAFVKKHVDAGTPIMSEHMDGGLITGYHEEKCNRQICFDGTVMPGWIDVDKLGPYAVYVLVKQGEPMPRGEITRLALKRALAKGAAHDWRGEPQGMAALRAYAADVADPTKDFSQTEEWFCWAAFERLAARRCCEVWLRSVAAEFAGQARNSALAAAKHYGRASEWYARYGYEVSTCEPVPRSLRDRARVPERIAAIAPLLEQGIAAEQAGLAALEETVRALG